MEKESKTVRVIASNIANGPRGINTVSGTVVVDHRARSKEITVTEGEAASLKIGGNFKIEELGEGKPFVRTPVRPKASRFKELADDVAALKRAGGSNSDAQFKKLEEQHAENKATIEMLTADVKKTKDELEKVQAFLARPNTTGNRR